MHPDELVQHHTQRFEDISERIGDVELKMVSVQQTVGRIKTDLYNGDDDPEKGLVPEIRAWLVEERADRRRRWKRSDKIAMLSILLILLAWPSAQVWQFIHTVYEITQEWHQVHKGEISHHSFFTDPSQPVLESNRKPQDAQLPMKMR